MEDNFSSITGALEEAANKLKAGLNEMKKELTPEQLKQLEKEHGEAINGAFKDFKKTVKGAKRHFNG